MTIAMDTFEISKKFKKAGFSQKQTEVFVDVIRDIDANNKKKLSTKEDLKILEARIKNFALQNTIAVVAVLSTLITVLKVF